MGWDEALFGWLVRLTKRAPPVPLEVLARQAHLAPNLDRLRVLAAAVAGRAIVVRGVVSGGGVSQGELVLPETLDVAPTRLLNEEGYVLRVVVSATAIREGLVPAQVLSPEEARARSWAIAEETLRIVEREWPGFAEARRRVVPTCSGLVHPLFGIVRGELGSSGDREALQEANSLPTGTELRGRDLEPRERVELGNEESENPLVHSFEKVHTIEEHRGGRKRLDGSDELAEHADALEELDLNRVIRSNERTQSLIRCDAMLESGASDVEDGARTLGLPYDEWNAAERKFRKAWCRVRVTRGRPPRDVTAAEARVARRLLALTSQAEATRARVLAFEAARRPRARQYDGDDIDDDAMVARHACLAAGVTPSDRLYVARRRRTVEVAVLLLLDASSSTDGWIDGQRVLDVECDAALVLGEALDGVIDDFGVASFHSQTRRDCRFDVVKGMRETWLGSRARLADIRPNGYTRIGPALRHGTTILDRTAARRRLLLVVTDGKPNDYDRYEGRYGVADVAHAVLEARARGVLVHGLAIDPSARVHLPRMFGLGGFTLLRDATGLAGATGDVVARMQR